MRFCIEYDRTYVDMGVKITDVIEIEEGGQIQLSPDEETYVLDLNSIPFALVSWRIGSKSYDLDESVTVTEDMLSKSDDGSSVLRVKGEYRSAYTIIVFCDDNGFIPDDAVVDEVTNSDGSVTLKNRFERILRISGGALNLTLPDVYKESGSELSIPVQPTDMELEEDSHVEFMGWMDFDSGTVHKAKSIFHASRRGVIYLRAKWGVKYDVPRMATVQFQMGSRGTVITGVDANGDPIYKGSVKIGEDENGVELFSHEWKPNGETIVWSDENKSNTYSFRVNSLSFKIPTTYPDYIAGDSKPRYMSYWIRVDGSDMNPSSNDTNLGFNIGGESGLFSGDGFADIYYPGDTISLRLGETVQLVPVWVASYTHRLIFDVSFAETISESVDDRDFLSEYTPRLIEWMKNNSIEPIFKGDEFQFKGVWENIGPKSMIWTRMPSSSPPLFKYFRTWVAEGIVFDISFNKLGGISFENLKNSIGEDSSLGFGLQPCTAQRIGLRADENSRVYECKLVAIWNGWDGSSGDYPYFPIVFEDSDWVEPVDGKGAPILPMCFIHPCTQFHDLNGHTTRIYTEFSLPGTGKSPSEGIDDPRPRGGGDSLKNKAFLNWNIRVDSYDGPVVGQVEAGTKVSVNITGAMMSTYYWGQFPGPEWKGGLEGTSSNPAYDFFTEGYTSEEIENGITWEMVQDKRTIWGPIYNAPTSSEGVVTQVVNSPNVPDVIIVEANWRKDSGTYLLRGDYTNGSATDAYAPHPNMFNLGINQSIEDTISTNLYEASTIAFGFRNRFVMDLGTTRQIHMKVFRVNPREYDDAISKDTDPTEYFDENGNLISESNDNLDKHPAKLNKYFYSDKWSNSKWYSELRRALDFWQNSVEESRSKYGGFQVYFESPPDEETRSGNTQGLSSLTGNRPLYPSFMYNVFLTGSLNPTYDGQLLSVTIPMTLARMTTAQDETNSEGGYATHVCRLNPGPKNSGEVLDTNPDDDLRLYYVDSLKASDKLLTYINYSEKDWEFVTPTDVDGWVCNRQYYKGTLATPTSERNAYGSPASLRVVFWRAEWRVLKEDGTYSVESKGVFAGDKLNVGKARDVTLTAVWGSTKATAIVDLETNRMLYFNETSSEYWAKELDSADILDESKDLKVVVSIPKGVTRASYTICGGGGCGAKQVTDKSSNMTHRVFNGGGGASGDFLNGTHILRGGEHPTLVVDIGVGGGFGGFRDGYGGNTSIHEVEFKEDVSSILSGGVIGALDFNEVSVQSKISTSTHVATANGGQPGTGGANSQGGIATTAGSASGGAGSSNYTLPGSDGDSNGNFPGGIGGSSVRKVFAGGRRYEETCGGGGGGASRVDIQWLSPLGEYIFKSAAGNGNGSKDGTKGVRGGGGGGGYTDGTTIHIGGHGFAMIQFY